MASLHEISVRGSPERADLPVSGLKPFERTRRFEFEQGTLETVIRRSLVSLISAQNPYTGLVSATTERARSISGHYDHWWLRDQMEAVRAINKRFIRDQYPTGTPIGDAIDDFTTKSMRGVFRLFSEEPWQEGFSQKVRRIRENNGHGFVDRTELEDEDKAPPVHWKTTGEFCDWPTQNQPDSYGVTLSAFVGAVKRGDYKPSPQEWNRARQIAEYLVRLEPHKITAYSMWEWGRTYSPTPLSTIASCATGLIDFYPYTDGELRRLMQRRINDAQVEIGKLFPTDYTTPWHGNTTDLATLHDINVGGILD
jgi:hypothetical protein